MDEASYSSHHVTIIEEAEPDLADYEIEDAPQALEDGGRAIIEKLKEINLGTTNDRRPTLVSALLMQQEEEEYIQALT